ncbi:hypothetical protein GMOD_00002625 [Pyrenophora seminiperda CCB06]|uniref:Uncharacterized protein n=1 Tax=Pyrenophora seminiperda CCB06 TaxID=1302712 RepID=A0A3M7M302_9PLEO|nr:hypothetical protein GMOD_00002625 [Pyrenophora seminiperda CCB06]
MSASRRTPSRDFGIFGIVAHFFSVLHTYHRDQVEMGKSKRRLLEHHTPLQTPRPIHRSGLSRHVRSILFGSSATVIKAVAQWLPRCCATIIGQWIAPDLPLSANHVNGRVRLPISKRVRTARERIATDVRSDMRENRW